MSVLTFFCLTGISYGQVAGNLGYSQSAAKSKAEQRERSKRILSTNDMPGATATFVEADVLINVLADEFVAVFGLSQEGVSAAECNQKLESTVMEFTTAIKELKVTEQDLHLDFITQTKIYGFEVQGDISREKLVGIELKKNLSVRYTDRRLLDKIVNVASKSKIHDLIKVDYVVRDVKAVQEQLMEEAAKVIKQKSARYEKLLDIKLRPPAQIFAEKYATHYPSGAYDSYTAAETEEIDIQSERQKHVVQRARKGRTFVFNGLDGDGFDHVINPTITEPVVQFTLYLKVKYEVEQSKMK